MPFQKGESGNPAGRPKGAPDRRQIVRQMLAPHAPELVEKAVEMALAGDASMLKLCLDKLIPNARERSAVKFDVDKGLAAAGSGVIGQVSLGDLSVEEGRSVLDLLTIQGKLQEQDELAVRVAALEEAQGVG
jgi:hypothetical protein